MNLPNTLSLLRIIFSPVFLLLFLSDVPLNVFLSFIVFTIAALTDWYDGWYARKYGFKTNWGQFLDPLADKILTSAAFIGFYILKQKDHNFMGTVEFIPVGVLVAILIFRDLVLTVVRSVQELRGREFKTSMISKTKTFVQMTFVFIIIGSLSLASIVKNTEITSGLINYLHSDFNYYILLLITILTVASGIAYIFESNPKQSQATEQKA